MIQRKDSWAEMTALWQKAGGIDAEKLAKAVRRKTIGMRLMASSEVLVGLVGVGFGIWMIAEQRYDYWVGVGGFIIFFSLAGTLATLWARKGAWVASSSGLRGQLKLTLKRAQAGVKLALVNLWALPFAAFLVGLIMYLRWDSLVEADPGRQQTVFIIISLGVLALIGTGIWAVWYKARKKREIERLETLLRDLEEGE